MGGYTSKLKNDYEGTLKYPATLIDLLITKIISFLSIIPCLIIFISFIAMKNRTFRESVAFQLSISCMLHSLSFVLPLIYNPINEPEKLICTFQSVLSTVFDLTSLSLTTSISFIAYKTSIGDSATTKLEKYITFGVAWFIPIIIGLFVAFYGNNHSGTNLICFPRSLPIMFIFSILSLIIFIANIVCVCLLMREVSSIVVFKNCKEKSKVLFECFKYILTQTITYGPFLIDIALKIKNELKQIKPTKGKKIYHCWIYFKDLTQCGTGLVFAIVYGLTPNIKEFISDLFSKKRDTPDPPDPLQLPSFDSTDIVLEN